MKQIDEQRLESDLTYRYEYLTDFVGFTNEDAKFIHGLAPQLMPRIPALVDSTYEKLLSYSATARHFLSRQHGYEGPLPNGLEELSQESEQIQFRKEHLRRYLTRLFGSPCDARMVTYLDMVGKMHTPKAGNKQIDVPLVQMNALMGLLSGVLMEVILDLELERQEEKKTLQAIDKLLWVQNDLINRHYAVAQENGAAASEANPATAAWK